MPSYHLFEHGAALPYQGDVQALRAHLQQSWQNLQERRAKFEPASPQPFVQIEGQSIRARNYLGVIQLGADSIYLLPKLFEGEGLEGHARTAMQAHWWWWLRYSKLLPYPRLSGRLQTLLDQPLECGIDLFTELCQEQLLPLRLRNYQQQQSNQRRLRGRVHLRQHLRQNIQQGQWQRLYCQYDSLELDLMPYQLLKYCFRLLKRYSRDAVNQKKLADLILKLESIPDTSTEQAAWQNLRLSPLFADMQQLIDYANHFLRQLLPSIGGSGARGWSWLFPAEQLFESFLSGFIQQEAPMGYRVELQEQGQFLASKGRFALRPDVVIYDARGRVQIADVKYKRVRSAHWESDVLQSDLYQLLAYGLRYASTELHLLYPSITSWQKSLSIHSPLQNKPFQVQVHGLPVRLSYEELLSWDEDKPIQEQFERLKLNLKEHLQRIFHLISK